MRFNIGVAIVAIAVFSAQNVARNTPVFIGTWKLNLAESKPGDDIQTETMKIEASGANTLTTFDESYRSGQNRHVEITRTWDGKLHELRASGLQRDGATEICEIVNASTHKIFQGIKGKTISELTAVVSDDGKKMTVTRKGGRDETLVFERQ